MCGLKIGNLLMEFKFFFVFFDIRIEKIFKNVFGFF